MLKPFLVEWWDDPESNFSLWGPTWVEDHRPHNGAKQLLIATAIMAANENHAKEQVTQAHNFDVELEWKTVEQQPYGWNPFTAQQLKDSAASWSQKPH